MDLCISPRDHTLRGNYFDSVVVSLMSYSRDMSKFIKSAQMRRSGLTSDELINKDGGAQLPTYNSFYGLLTCKN
jgi:hypothetical protein